MIVLIQSTDLVVVPRMTNTPNRLLVGLSLCYSLVYILMYAQNELAIFLHSHLNLFVFTLIDIMLTLLLCLWIWSFNSCNGLYDSESGSWLMWPTCISPANAVILITIERLQRLWSFWGSYLLIDRSSTPNRDWLN